MDTQSITPSAGLSEAEVDGQLVAVAQFIRTELREPAPGEIVVVDHFTPGLYVREFRAVAGCVIVSAKHGTEHPFVVSKGRVRVWTKEDGVVVYEAGHHGVTKPGTQRVLFVDEDLVWTTFHPTDKTSVEDIKREILLPSPVSSACLEGEKKLLGES